MIIFSHIYASIFSLSGSSNVSVRAKAKAKPFNSAEKFPFFFVCLSSIGGLSSQSSLPTQGISQLSYDSVIEAQFFTRRGENELPYLRRTELLSFSLSPGVRSTFYPLLNAFSSTYMQCIWVLFGFGLFYVIVGLLLSRALQSFKNFGDICL